MLEKTLLVLLALLDGVGDLLDARILRRLQTFFYFRPPITHFIVKNIAKIKHFTKILANLLREKQIVVKKYRLSSGLTASRSHHAGVTHCRHTPYVWLALAPVEIVT